MPQVRIPEELVGRIREAASASRRSFNQEAVLRLERSFGADGRARQVVERAVSNLGRPDVADFVPAEEVPDFVPADDLGGRVVRVPLKPKRTTMCEHHIPVGVECPRCG